MNKKIKVGILSCSLIVIILLTRPVNGVTCTNTSLITDKDTYYTQEKIKINASWDLYYDPEIETAFMQIQIFDAFDNNICNSPKYYAIGTLTKNWTVNIQLLDLPYSNFANILYIKLYNFYEDSHAGGEEFYLYESLTISIIKRGLSCQLSDFKDVLTLGETNYFTATFFDTKNNSLIKNETLNLFTLSNGEILFQTNLTTNENGEISFNISSTTHLNPGRNELRFSIKDNLIYNDTTFSYELFVKKIPVFVNITRFHKNLEKSNSIDILLYFYYLYNQSEKPVGNEMIKLVFYSDTTFEHELDLMTNQSGLLSIVVSLNNIIFQTTEKEVYIDITFHGTSQLENLTLSLHLNIENFLFQGISNQFLLTNISLFSILLMLLSLISLKLYNFQRNKFKLIRDLTFKF